MVGLITGAFIVGIMGSLHCIGMCGPIVIAVGTSHNNKPVIKLLAFVVGKALTYAILGTIAGIIGSAFYATKEGKTGFAILGLVAGSVMIFIGAHTIWSKFVSKGTPSTSPVSALISNTMAKHHRAAPFFIGMLAGLLPCGLVYAMLAQALTAETALMGALIMLAFGIGTIPSLLATGTLTSLLSAKVRRIGEIIAASSIIIMGGMTIFRGIKFLMNVGSCCGKG